LTIDPTRGTADEVVEHMVDVLESRRAPFVRRRENATDETDIRSAERDHPVLTRTYDAV